MSKRLSELVLWLKQTVSIACLDTADWGLPLCLATNEVRIVSECGQHWAAVLLFVFSPPFQLLQFLLLIKYLCSGGKVSI